MASSRITSTVCSLSLDDSNKCFGDNCETCGWSFKEIERRKELPLVPLRNGLRGKKVGTRSFPEEEESKQ